MAEEGIEALRDRVAGEDEAVYNSVDTESLPDWWQRGIEEHNDYGLRPYRPPRFEDGVLTTPLIKELEAAHEVDIQILGVNANYGDDWTIFIDEESVFDISRRRDPNGFTVFEQSSETFANAVESVLDGSEPH